MRRSRSSQFLFLFLLLVVAAGSYWLWQQRQKDTRINTRERPAVTSPVESQPDEEVKTVPEPPSHSEAIEVFFSNAYTNDRSVGQYDPENIDRKLEAFIGSAEQELDCALFELESKRIAEALIAARRRGVKVRIVAESDYMDNPEMQHVIKAGIPVVGDKRSRFMHNKFFVLDRKAVWTGSLNATDNGAWQNNNNALVIRSPELAENYRTEFDEMFLQNEFGPRSPSNTPHTLVKLDGIDIYNYFSPEDDPMSKIMRFVEVAKVRIRFLAFSMTDDDLGELLVSRHQAGIDVAGVLENRGSGLKYSELGRLQKAGVNVLRDGNKYIMHHKVIVVDGKWTILGSFNFTGNASESNDENLLIIKSEEIARRFEDEYERIAMLAKAQSTLP